INEEMEGRKHQQRRYDDEDRLHRHNQIRRQRHGLVKKIQGRIAKIKSVTPKTLEKTQGVLEKKRSADGGNKLDQSGLALKRAIGHSLQCHGCQPADHHAGDDHEKEDEGRRPCCQLSSALQHQENLHADKRTEDKDFAVREVNELQDAVNHGVAQSDQSIHEAQNDAVHQNLRQDFECELQNRQTF